MAPAGHVPGWPRLPGVEGGCHPAPPSWALAKRLPQHLWHGPLVPVRTVILATGDDALGSHASVGGSCTYRDRRPPAKGTGTLPQGQEAARQPPPASTPGGRGSDGGGKVALMTGLQRGLAAGGDVPGTKARDPCTEDSVPGNEALCEPLAWPVRTWSVGERSFKWGHRGTSKVAFF